MSPSCAIREAVDKWCVVIAKYIEPTLLFRGRVIIFARNKRLVYYYDHFRVGRDEGSADLIWLKLTQDK